MTTTSHLNDFVKLDSEILDEHSKTADELLKAGHLDLENTLYLAKLLFCLERYDESIKQFKKALSLKGDDEEALSFIAVCCFKKRDYRTSIEYLTESLRINPRDETALLYMMLSYEFLGDYVSAAECGERIFKNNPKNTRAVNRLIDYHFEMENYEACLDYIRQTDYKDNDKKAVILYRSGNYEECIELSGKIRTAEAYRLAGKSYHKLGNTAKAVRYLLKSYEKDSNTDTLFEISEIYLKSNDYLRSIHYLKMVLLYDGANAEACCRIAYAYLQTADWYGAIEYCRKALEITKKLPKVYATLAEAYSHIECDFEKPDMILDEGIGENPDSAMLWAQKGGHNYAYNPHIFRQSYEKALSLSPGNTDIYIEYIHLLLLDDDIETAKKIYNEMLLFNPLFERSFEELKEMMIFPIFCMI